MEKVKRCGGYKGHWECSEDYPDHEVPVEKFGKHARQKDGLQDKCRKCKKYHNGIINPANNPKRPRHPETNQLKVNWQTARAKKYYGGMPEDSKTDERWKVCREMATKDSESIDWVTPDDNQPSNVIPFAVPPKFDNSYEEVTNVSKGRKRDQKVVSYIKAIYDTCAVDGCDYSLYDVAHIHALKHGADDLPSNCIPLCPNHHRDLDRGMLRLSEPNGRSESDPIEFKLNGFIGKIILNGGHEVDSKYVKGCINEIGKYLDRKGDASENAISES